MLCGKLPKRDPIFLGHDQQDYFVVCKTKQEIFFYRFNQEVPFLTLDCKEIGFYIRCCHEINKSLIFLKTKETVSKKNLTNGQMIDDGVLSLEKFYGIVSKNLNINLRNKEISVQCKSENLMTVAKSNYSNVAEDAFENFICTLEVIFGEKSVGAIRDLKWGNLAVLSKKDLSVKYLGKYPIQHPQQFCISPDELTVAMCNGSSFAIIDLET